MAEDAVHLSGLDTEGEYVDDYFGEEAAALVEIDLVEVDPIEVDGDAATGNSDPTIGSYDPPSVSSESCFSLTGRILEDRRRRLLPEHVEMLVCIKDWELGDKRKQHTVVTEHKELCERFDNLWIVDSAPGIDL